MILPADLRAPRGSEAGFTLLELVIVFVILGLLLTLFVTRVRGPSPALTLRAAANELAAGLREGRSAAISGDRPVIITIDAAHRGWRAADGAVKTFPSGTAVRVMLADGKLSSAAIVGIRFEGDGSSSGGRVDLASGAKRMAVAVNWLTGRVTVANAP
jgi:general secretion pathway protein H